MGNFRYAIGRPFDAAKEGDFWAPTATISDGDKAGFDKDNVKTEHLQRAWRSADTSASHHVGVDLGQDRAIQAVLIEGLNVTDFEVKGATAAQGSNIEAVGTTLADFTGTNLGQNPRTKRYGTLVVASGTYRYVGLVILPSQARTDGTAEYAVGRIIVVQTLRTMTRNWGKRYSYQPDSIGSVVEFPGGNVETTASSDLFLRFDLDGDFDIRVSAEVDDVNRLSTLTKADRMLHFENRASDSQKIHTYLSIVDDPPIVLENYPLISIDVALREVI